MQAVEKCGREWRGVLTFLKKHSDVLGQEGEIYNLADPNDKKMQERIRKRAAKLMNGRQSFQR